MSKPNLSPTAAFTRSQRFEELELIFESKGTFRGGLIDGEFELSFDLSGDWWISDVWISTHGTAADGASVRKLLAISPSEQPALYTMLIDSVVHAYESRVPEWIEEELAEEGVSFRRAA